VALVPARRRHRHGPSGTFFGVALGAPQAPHHGIELRIPPGESSQSVRTAAAGMAARALEKERVLAKLIAQRGDSELPHAGTVQNHSGGLKSDYLREEVSYSRGRGVVKLAI